MTPCLPGHPSKTSEFFDKVVNAQGIAWTKQNAMRLSSFSGLPPHSQGPIVDAFQSNSVAFIIIRASWARYKCLSCMYWNVHLISAKIKITISIEIQLLQ